MAARISAEDFSTMFIHALLFEPKIVVPDVYFFNSPYILSHLRTRPGKRVTILETAIERGVVEPALRQSAQTFTEISQYLSSNKISGLLSASDSAYVAGRLDQCLHRRKLDLLWPERMASSYEQLLVTTLSADESPGSGAAKIPQDLWEATEKYRVDTLGFATAIANQREGNYGLRRADVLRALAVETGAISRSGDETPTEDEIIYSAGDGAEVVSRFVDWIDDLYIANQSRRFGLQASTNSRHNDDLGLVAASIGFNQSPSVAQLDTFDFEIEVPALTTLLALEPDRFMDLREDGRDWYGAIHRFLTTPNAYNRSAAERSLEGFASAVRNETRSHRPHLNRGRASAVAFGGAVAATAADLTTYALDGPPVATLGSVIATGFVLYRWHKTRQTESVRVRKFPEQFISLDSGSHPSD